MYNKELLSLSENMAMGIPFDVETSDSRPRWYFRVVLLHYALIEL